MQTITDWKQFHADEMAKMYHGKRELAVEFLRGYFSEAPDTLAEIKEVASKDPQGWWTLYHHGWGTSVRNLLRRNGYSEADCGDWINRGDA